MEKPKLSKHFIVILFVFILLFFYSFVESKFIEYTKTEIINSQIPKEFNNFKIIFVSDLHERKYPEPLKIKKVVEKINKQNPDMIILGGDYANSLNGENITFAELANLKARYGIYGVYGNHDIEKNNFIKTEIKDINNNSYWIEKNGEKIKLGGVGDLWTADQILSNTTSDVKDNDYTILVSHNPDYIEEIKTENKVDLVLSGHTHGGQITIFGLFAPLNPSRYGYLKGLYKFANKDLYITRGIGEFFGPFRFFSRPEISELILKSK